MSTWTKLQLEGRVKVIQRSRAIGWIWISIGYALGLFICLLASLIMGVYAGDSFQRYWIFAVFGISFFLVLFLISRGFRYLSPNAKTLLENDPRPPILYLRSFQDDETVIGGESSCVKALAEFGPVIAIGKPNEKLPSIGAGRLYVGDAHWQDVIKLLLQHVQFVVLRFAFSEGLWWELELVTHRISPEKILIYLPWASHASQEGAQLQLGIPFRNKKKLFWESYEGQYAQFRNVSHKFFPYALPEEGENAPFLCFDSEWHPTLLTPPKLNLISELLYGGRVRASLQEFGRRFGVELKPTRKYLYKYSLLWAPMIIAFSMSFWNAKDLTYSGSIGQSRFQVLSRLGLLSVWEKQIAEYPDPTYPSMVKPLRNILAGLTEKQIAGLEAAIKEELANREKELGENNVAITTALNDLVMLYEFQRQYAKAEPLLSRLLVIMEKSLGPYHLSFAMEMEHYATLLGKLGREEEAEAMVAKARVIQAAH